MSDTYLISSGQHPEDVETELLYEVQSRKPRGKYVTRVRTKRRLQAWFWYSSLNIGYGHAKRLLCDGTVLDRRES